MSNEVVSRDEVVKSAGKAVGGIGGGIALLALNAVTGFWPAAIIGGIIAGAGLAIHAKWPDDRTAGKVAIAAGAVTIASAIPVVGGIASTLLWGGGIVLLGAGIFSAFKFYSGFKSRQ